MLKAIGPNGKDWKVLPAGLVHGAYLEALSASTNGINGAEHEDLLNVIDYRIAWYRC